MATRVLRFVERLVGAFEPSFRRLARPYLGDSDRHGELDGLAGVLDGKIAHGIEEPLCEEYRLFLLRFAQNDAELFAAVPSDDVVTTAERANEAPGQLPQ